MTADIDGYRTNLYDELNGEALYEALAAAEVAQAVADSRVGRATIGADTAGAEPRHRAASSSSDLRTAVLGANGRMLELYPEWSDERFPLYAIYTSPLHRAAKVLHSLSSASKSWAQLRTQFAGTVGESQNRPNRKDAYTRRIQ